VCVQVCVCVCVWCSVRNETQIIRSLIMVIEQKQVGDVLM